jgi:hypothetical protein
MVMRRRVPFGANAKIRARDTRIDFVRFAERQRTIGRQPAQNAPVRLDGLAAPWASGRLESGLPAPGARAGLDEQQTERRVALWTDVPAATLACVAAQQYSRRRRAQGLHGE